MSKSDKILTCPAVNEQNYLQILVPFSHEPSAVSDEERECPGQVVGGYPLQLIPLRGPHRFGVVRDLKRTRKSDPRAAYRPLIFHRFLVILKQKLGVGVAPLVAYDFVIVLGILTSS